MAIKLNIQAPKRALNKAFLKQRPLRSEIDLFKNNLIRLLGNIDEIEREENQKNHIRDFLRDTFYKDTNEINTKDSKDLVIHLGKTNKDKVGVIIEAKRPSNKNEMLTADKPNAKAFQELVLYYLRERIEENNTDIKYCVATNIYEWYIIEASYFEKLFFRNKAFVNDYEQWRDGKKVTKDTNLFYNDIAKPFIDGLEEEINCTYFDIRDYEKVLKNESTADDKNLIALLKILSPFHLLKVPFADDSNKLNEKFYKELLHIIGLEETKKGGKTVIDRKEEGKRNSGSLIENTITILETENSFHKITDISAYGETRQTQLFNIALELCITWINRILFLKLLEGQLVNYHKGDRRYRFLNSETFSDFDELYKLFHQVLAKTDKERTEAIQRKYSRIPYLNSSLFEFSDLEDGAIKINSLDNSETLPLLNTTILKELKKKSDKLLTLDYLFKFLDAFDFASEGTEDIQEDENKTLINASVLGKVFEKINGYKDGSVFTPGFITMYMCRQTIRLAVMQKFKEKYGWNIDKFEDIQNYLTDRKSSKDILEFNGIINSLRLCDPAVGSGHFLVSALNEIIAIKSELGLFADAQGSRITDYEIVIENDELLVTDRRNGDIFEYRVQNGKHISNEVQRLQKTLFHEKQTIIENCLFGVDINPKSVSICCLRLWIELLKNAYYKEPDFTELETLPNIDINIKCGNSLLSRFPLDADLSKALKSIKYNIETYRGFVNDYKNELNRDVKRGLLKIIDTIKSDFRTEIFNNDPKVIRLSKLGGELYNLFNQNRIFELNKAEQKAREQKKEKLEADINKLSKEIDEIKTNAIYKNAFEWRFEFPEVLSNDGEFEGFDVVIGNPPYFSISTDEKLKILSDKYETYSQTGDIYSLFYELANNIQKVNGIQSLIISNKWMRANYGINLRRYILKKSNPLSLIDFGQNLIFDNTSVYTSIIISQKSKNNNKLIVSKFNNLLAFDHTLETQIHNNKVESNQFGERPWNIIDKNITLIKQKIEANAKPLKDWDVKINRGVLTGLNKAFIINKTTKDKLIENDITSSKFIKPILRGRDTRKYYAEYKDYYLINIPKGYTIKTNTGRSDIVMEPTPRYGQMEFDVAWAWFYNKHKAIANHLFPFKNKAEKRDDKGDYWWELRACSYIEAFEKPKIIFSEIVSQPQFYYDEKGYYPEATVFFISGNNLKYLTALLNSKAVTFFFKSFYMGGDLGVAIRYKKIFLEQTPIPVPTEIQEIQINDLVDKIILQKQQGEDTTELEKEIDELVYKLYDLMEEEIKIVEGK